MIVCLEGASAVGKSSVARVLAEVYGYKIVPEVNKLFKREKTCTDPYWYLERQVERWSIAKEYNGKGLAVCLDGDVFQPLWYNWIFIDLQLHDYRDVARFFEKKIQQGQLGYPDHYYLLSAPVTELHLRKGSDLERRRKNFEMHLNIIPKLSNYFSVISAEIPGLVSCIENVDSSATAAEITVGTQIDNIGTAESIMQVQKNIIFGDS